MSKITDCLYDICDEMECMNESTPMAGETESDHVIIINPNMKVED